MILLSVNRNLHLTSLILLPLAVKGGGWVLGSATRKKDIETHLVNKKPVTQDIGIILITAADFKNFDFQNIY